MEPSSKIFGIGLSKTGTKSLSKALEILGYKSIHYPNDPVTIQQIANKQFKLSIMEHYDAAIDTPVAAHYKELDVAFPNSKFILTTRRLESWLESMQFHLAMDYHLLKQPMNEELTMKAKFLIAMYKAMYLGNSFEEMIGKLEVSYKAHHEKVRSFFHSRLLVLDVEDKDKWQKLCGFLEKPIPDVPYPKENKRSLKAVNWPKGMDECYFSEDQKLSTAGRARTIAYRYNTYLNLRDSKILNVCLPGEELKEAMSSHDVEDWVIGTDPPKGRFDVIIVYDVLDHLNSEEDAIQVLLSINRIAAIDANLYVLCHPYSSRLGTHLFSENKAYLHLLCPEAPGQKPTLKLPKPIRVYKSWFEKTGWDIYAARETTEQVEDFFKVFVHLNKFNTNVQFAEYFMKKKPKLFL